MIIKTILDKRGKNKEGKYPVKIRFSEKRKESYYSLNLYAFPEEFDSMSELFLPGIDKTQRTRNAQYNSLINAVKEQVRDILVEAKRKGCNMSAQDMRDALVALYRVVEEDNTPTLNESFHLFIEGKKGRTSELYASTLKKIESFAGKCIEFEDVTPKWLSEFDGYMAEEIVYSNNKKQKVIKTKGLSVNTRSLYFRNIRAVFNDAIDNDVIPLNLYPFRKFKIKREDTVKRAMKQEDIQALFSYVGSDVEVWAVDMAKIIFYSIGINVKDLFYLDDIGDFIAYRRAKTGRLYNIAVEPELAVLLEKYKGSSGLIFKEQFQDYTSFGKKINKYLGEACEALKITKITTYSLRHTWATIAARLDISTEAIAKALGHGKKTVTDVYIDFDMTKVQKANRRVIDFVLKK